jgi:Ca-activated chloride channel family protein
MLRFVLVALIGVASVAAQDSPYTLKVDVAMVSVDVAVFNSSGVPVEGLSKEDFAVYEDGRRQAIQVFASSDTPYNVLLVIDRSASMTDTFPLLIEAVNRFISNLRVQDRFALAAFNTTVKRLIDWRSVRAGRQQTVELGAGGGTDLYAALNWAVKEFGKVHGRKAALFFTDGDYRLYDEVEDAKAFRKIIRAVKQTKSPFHFVGLGADPERGGNRLVQLAQETGGHAHFPQSVQEVVPLYDQISRELGISYTLGYLSDRPARDGTYRRIEVSPSGTGYRISQSRPGYYAN